jgi:hypothetical protein
MVDLERFIGTTEFRSRVPRHRLRLRGNFADFVASFASSGIFNVRRHISDIGATRRVQEVQARKGDES